MADSPTLKMTDLLGLMRRQLEASRWAKRLLIALFVVGWFGTLLPSESAASTAYMLMLGAMIGWVACAFASARTSRLAQHVALLAGAGAPVEQVEAALAAALGRFTLYRTVRVVLYHHLAVLRHRQGRFDEASAICATLLVQRDLGLAGRLRRTLLLILAESRLQRGDAAGAYAPLVTLHRLGAALTMTERVHLLAAQVRYEALCGYDDLALHRIDAKLPVIDLLPPAAAAICHDRLADAARRTGRAALADWLTERADLLAPDRAGEPANPLNPLAGPMPTG